MTSYIFASLLEICWKSSERVENCLSVLNFILRTLKYLTLHLSMHANFPSFFRLISSSNPEDISTYGDLVLNNSFLMSSLFSTVRHPLSSFDKLVNGLPVLITLFQMFFYFSLLVLRFSHWQKAFFKQIFHESGIFEKIYKQNTLSNLVSILNSSKVALRDIQQIQQGRL